MAWTGIKENSTYTAQITPFYGKVYAEILCKEEDKGFYSVKLDLWLSVLSKSFGGGMFRQSPRQQDYERANAWVEEQLSMIEKYATVIVTKPKYLRD